MTTTVLALFKEQRDAEAAVIALQSAQFDTAQLGIARPGTENIPRFGRNAIMGIAVGTVACAASGALIGALATGGGAAAAFMFGLAGAATGVLAGLLISLAMTRQHSLHYEDEVAAGRTLVSVEVTPDHVETARGIMLTAGAFEAAPLDTPMPKAS